MRGLGTVLVVGSNTEVERREPPEKHPNTHNLYMIQQSDIGAGISRMQESSFGVVDQHGLDPWSL
jgi:hypothetical protein